MLNFLHLLNSPCATLASLWFCILLACFSMNLKNSKNLNVQGGSINKVVDCILCLKGYHEWKKAGGVGVWRYGGTVKITSSPKELPNALTGSERADESGEELQLSKYEQLLEFIQLSNEASFEESKTTNALTFLFDRFGLWLLQAYLRDGSINEELPLNAMVDKIYPIFCSHSNFTFVNIILQDKLLQSLASSNKRSGILDKI